MTDNSKHSDPTLTLSLGGVNFTLSPNDDRAIVNFQKSTNDLLLDLSNFSGTLRVALSREAMQETTATMTKSTSRLETFKPRASMSTPSDVTPKTTHVSDKTEEKKRHPCNEHDTPTSPAPPFKKTRQTSPVEEELVDAPPQQQDGEYSQPTLLGQPDFSQTQTQLSSTDVDANERAAGSQVSPSTHDDDDNEEPSKVQKIMGAACSQESDEKHVTEEQLSVKSSPPPPPREDTSTVKPPPPTRVSLGTSPMTAPKGQDPPCPRWGHTMTDIGMNRILIYGGQSYDSESGFPKTMNDLYIFNTKEKTWFKPFNCDGMPRQWHSSTFLPERQLLISFGGEAANPKTGKVKTTDQVMVLDTEIMLWYPPSVSGDIPSGRSGHTATMLPKTNELVVFGGVKGSKWLNTVSVLDTMRWTWSSPKLQGSAPKPRSYHSATAIGNRIVVFGGNNAATSFNSVHVLEAVTRDENNNSDTKKWSWTNPTVTGYSPSPRTGHSATLLSDNKTICIYGGWDPNADDDDDDEEGNSNNNNKRGEDDSHMIFQDCFLLDTEKWSWKKGPKLKYHAELSSDIHGENGGAKRVGHAAVLNGSGEILVFGGRIPCDRFSDDFQVLSLSTAKKTVGMK